jgi:hypothetical protein
MASTPTKPPNPLNPTYKEASPDNTALPQLPQSNGDTQPTAGPRRSSFGFLRRKSSSETRGGHRSASGSKMSRKQKALAQEEALRRQREAAMLPKQPPRLPTHSPLPQIDHFGGADERPDSVAIVSNRAGAYNPNPNPNFSRPSVEQRAAPNAHGPMPPMPESVSSYMDFDPYPRTESMTHRGRYSYASSAISTVNSPRRVRRRKDPTPFKYVLLPHTFLLFR